MQTAMSDGASFSLTLMSMAGVVLLFGAIAVGREKYGRMPRGFRWTETVWGWLTTETPDLMLRVFYPEVWAERYRTVSMKKDV